LLANGAITDGFNAIVSDDAVNIVQFAVGACEMQRGGKNGKKRAIVAVRASSPCSCTGCG
jgi:hypothetical protein